ncbi:hypothetical protein ACLOJK_016307 [Asimina triloba]
MSGNQAPKTQMINQYGVCFFLLSPAYERLKRKDLSVTMEERLLRNQKTAQGSDQKGAEHRENESAIHQHQRSQWNKGKRSEKNTPISEECIVTCRAGLQRISLDLLTPEQRRCTRLTIRRARRGEERNRAAAPTHSGTATNSTNNGCKSSKQRQELQPKRSSGWEWDGSF